MRAIRLRAPGGLDRLELVDEPPPQPRADNLLVRVHACSLNYRDRCAVHGKPPCGNVRVSLSDGAGKVIAAGDGVEGFAVGDLPVSTFYPYWLGGARGPAIKRDIPGEHIGRYVREVVCAPAHTLTKAPTGWGAIEATTLTCTVMPAWRGMVGRGRVKPGDTVPTLGTVRVSLFALQFVKAAGARVIATSSSDEKFGKLKRLDAESVMNCRAEPNYGERAKKLTDGRGVDHVVEVGEPRTLAQSIAGRRTDGHVALIGVLTGFAGEVAIPALFSNQIRVSGISIGSRADSDDMLRAIVVNQLEPVIDCRFPLQVIVAAFRHFESQPHFGKVCV